MRPQAPQLSSKLGMLPEDHLTSGPFCNILKLAPVHLPMMDVAVDSLSASTVTVSKEAVKSLHPLDYAHLFNGLQTRKNVFVSIRLPQLCRIHHEVLATLPCLAMNRVQELLCKSGTSFSLNLGFPPPHPFLRLLSCRRRR